MPPLTRLPLGVVFILALLGACGDDAAHDTAPNTGTNATTNTTGDAGSDNASTTNSSTSTNNAATSTSNNGTTSTSSGTTGTNNATTSTNNAELPVIDTTPLEDAALDAALAVEATPQRLGDPAAGERFLLYGDYVGSGIPYDAFVTLIGENTTNLLEREGDNASLPPAYNAFDAPNGVRVAGGLTCMGCHSGFVDGQYIVGLGNSSANYSGEGGDISLALSYVRGVYGRDSPEAEITEIFVRGAEAITPYATAPFAGVNPAFRIEEAAAAHRLPGDLSWTDTPLFDIPDSGLASDVPPWWTLKKKHALYYNGMGRGDHARMIQQIMVVAVVDLAQAQRIDAASPDLLAFIHSLEPPAWPGDIDPALAAQGEAVFTTHCSRCHGTYGDDWTYPNLIVPLDEVGTDPAYATYYVQHPALINWVNQSWFGEVATVTPKLGYVAPPLDGIWASAPYLHNASIPTLAALLDSTLRPERWRRRGAYDRNAVGLDHDIIGGVADTSVYDTTVEGYSNQGHTFGDALSRNARSALLEYLKTL